MRRDPGWGTRHQHPGAGPRSSALGAIHLVDLSRATGDASGATVFADTRTDGGPGSRAKSVTVCQCGAGHDAVPDTACAYCSDASTDASAGACANTCRDTGAAARHHPSPDAIRAIALTTKDHIQHQKKALQMQRLFFGVMA